MTDSIKYVGRLAALLAGAAWFASFGWPLAACLLLYLVFISV